METSKRDPVSVFVDDAKSTENIESIINSSLRIFEVKFLQSNNSYQASFLIDFEYLVSDLSACGFCLGWDLFQDFSGQKHQLFVVSRSLSSF